MTEIRTSNAEPSLQNHPSLRQGHGVSLNTGCVVNVLEVCFLFDASQGSRGTWDLSQVIPFTVDATKNPGIHFINNGPSSPPISAKILHIKITSNSIHKTYSY